MKSQIIAIWSVVFGTLPGQVAAQDWSSWITPNNHDLQYRWLGSAPGGSPTCQLQLRDLKLNVESVVSLRIDYRFDNAAQSTREVVTITGSKDESLGERTIDHCVSVDDLHVNEVVGGRLAMRVADRRLWAVQQALGRTVVVKSRSPSLFHSSHFNWEPAEGLEMFRYVSSILVLG